ncbi:hypothetical protein [Endozoicomonas sp. GU-1]|uniref:hypothetical protein n=1 Tax=Endozoicomonas sp. GU-1 TaxID=3009078 RepID=UPI0022B34CFF|nr:hypothetical protein [Endozoicomonas sp. GU-1]WBA81604.1 hypothetical protein O2T12_25625 [Endozoicomonas sp. GU-1]WBA84557.1 hypothetical protein O3276_14795 [Endozoicomonas sp. GU-1]
MMNSENAIVDSFANISDYHRSSEFVKNPSANIFTPLRKVTSEPAENNYLPLSQELKFKITRHLNLKDFLAFSSINVDNYLSLRSDDLLVKMAFKNKPKVRILERLEDLKQKAEKYPFDIDEKIKTDQSLNVIIPSIALSPGPARLIIRDIFGINDYQPYDFVKLFQQLCMLAKGDSSVTEHKRPEDSTDDPLQPDRVDEMTTEIEVLSVNNGQLDSTCNPLQPGKIAEVMTETEVLPIKNVQLDPEDVLFTAHICSLAIDINNRMSLKGEKYATTFALSFLNIALQVKQVIKTEDKTDKVDSLANMIENNRIHLGRMRKAHFNRALIKAEFDWDTFINGLTK